MFNLFRGDYKQADGYFIKLNDIFHDQLNFKWEQSFEGGIFLNVKLIIKREAQEIETMYYVKPSNMRIYLHYRSCHPQHTFKSIVYSQALQGILINSREEWNIEYQKELINKFLEQVYPLKPINGEFKRA